MENLLGYGLNRKGRINKDDAAGVFPGKAQVTLTDGLEEVLGFALDAVEGIAGGAHAFAGGGAVKIEDKGDVRECAADGEGIDESRLGRIDPAGDALVDGR